MTLLAAYQSFLSRYTDKKIFWSEAQLRIGIIEIEGLIGFFVNTLVYRANLSGRPTFQDVLYQVRQKALKAYEYQDIPFEKIVEVVQPERSTSHSPIFQTMFILQNMKQEFPVLSSRSIEMIESHSPIAKFDLSVMAAETEEGLLLLLSIIRIYSMLLLLNGWQDTLRNGYMKFLIVHKIRCMT